MAMNDYERYQLEWMIEHGHSLTELVRELASVQRSYEVAPDYNKQVDELFGIWEADVGFGGEVFASEPEWSEAESKEQDPARQSVRDWYVSAFPDDELGPDINAGLTFEDALDAVSLGGGFYDAIGVGDSVVRERVFAELGSRFGIGYDAIYDACLSKTPVVRPDAAQDRASIKDRLVVLDTRPGWDGQTDALLYDPQAPKDLTPFVIASGFDAGTRSWRSGSYRKDLMAALCEFRRENNPAWTISGCTPADVTELYSGVYRFEPWEAEEVARTVNEWMSGYDELFSDEITACVERRAAEGKLVCQNTPEAFAACAARRGAKLVAPEDIRAFIASYEKGEGRATPGMYAAVEPSGWFTVCDNSTGECFVESFETIAGADAYMAGADPRQARETDRAAAVGIQRPSRASEPGSIARDATEVARSADTSPVTARNAAVHH